jgi:cathepsin B
MCNVFHKNTSPFITAEHLEEKRSESSFEVYSYEEHPFKNWSLSDLQALLGVSTLALKDTSDVDRTTDEDLPTNFDSRTKWGKCIHKIRDQGKCGSCWAFAASEVLSDRFCIESKGKLDVVLSPQDMVSCDYLDSGCNGGIPYFSWLYLQWRGIVTDECKPYTSGNGSVEKCKLFSKNCHNKDVEYKKYKASTYYTLKTINDIKKNIYEKGPVETGFSVYDDFLSYNGGIYKKGPNATFLGGHAVKIIGWGHEEETGTDYWIVANSWGNKWGLEGLFKIAFGECGIENCIAGDPAL